MAHSGFAMSCSPTSELTKHYGVLAMIAGTFGVTLLAMLMALLLGMGAAI